MNYPLVTFFLTISLLFLWVPAWRKLWICPFFIAVVLGLIFQIFSIMALLPIAFLFFLVFLKQKKDVVYDFFIFIIVCGLFLHKLPGFMNLQIFSKVIIAPGCLPFTFYLNLDKMIAGIFLLSIIPLSRTFEDWKKVGRYCSIFILILMVILFLITWIFNYVRFQPKWPSFSFVWIFSNLFITASSEEAFFRGFIQRKLGDYWASYSWGKVAALIITSIFFGLAHFSAGMLFMIFAGVAAIFYGLSYQLSGKIETAIGVHFLLNFFHFVGFSYPGLSGCS